MRSRVLVRNRKPAETGTSIAGRSNAKRARSTTTVQDTSADQAGCERQVPNFELPQLDALLLDLDGDVDDGRLVSGQDQAAGMACETSMLVVITTRRHQQLTII